MIYKFISKEDKYIGQIESFLNKEVNDHLKQGWQVDKIHFGTCGYEEVLGATNLVDYSKNITRYHDKHVVHVVLKKE